jgi:hypothetical protein
MDQRGGAPTLIPAEDVAAKLLEEATLLAWRTRGADGLVPVLEGERTFYRPADVEHFIGQHLTAA